MATGERALHEAAEQSGRAVPRDRQRYGALPANLLSDVNHLIPPALFTRAARATFTLATSPVGRPTWNVVVSNIPGPQFPLYSCGARLVANYPISAVTDGLGLNITDVWTLLDGLDLSLTELEDAGR